MLVTEEDIARIPATNLRVPVDEFARVWSEAERLGFDDMYGAGMAVTCRWIARATVRPSNGGRWYLAFSPLTHRESPMAYEEMIQAEYLEAEKREVREDLPPDRIEFNRGVAALLRWAWARRGPVPVKLTETST